MHQVLSVLDIIPSVLINKGDTKPIILETCCCRSYNRFINDFVKGTLVWIYDPNITDVICASLEAIHELTLHYELINVEDKVSVLEGTGLFMFGLKYRLLSTQDHFMDLQRRKKTEGSSTVTWYKSVLKLSNQLDITVHYKQITHPHMLHSYNIIYSTVYSLAIIEFFTSEKNQNLTHLDKILI